METIFFSIRRDDLQLDGGLMSSFSAPWWWWWWWWGAGGGVGGEGVC